MGVATVGMTRTVNPSPRPPRVIQDGAVEWWTRPTATELGGRVYAGGVDSTGKIVAAASGGVPPTTLASPTPADDHYAPAILVTADQVPLAIYAFHSEDNFLRVRRGTTIADLTGWNAETTINMGGAVSYAQIVRNGSDVHVFCRVAARYWAWTKSSDWGVTWGTPQHVHDLTEGTCYAAFAAVGTTVRVAFTGHPTVSDNNHHDIWYYEINLTTGDITIPSSGATIANLFTATNLPVLPTTADKAFTVDVARTTQLFDVSTGPEPEIAFATKTRDDATNVDAQYQYAVLTGGSWVVSTIVAAGSNFGYLVGAMYLGGMTFANPAPGGVVVLSRSATDGTTNWALERYTTTNHGTSWVAAAISAMSTARYVRPRAVKDTTTNQTIAMELTSYAAGDYSHYVSGLRLL